MNLKIVRSIKTDQSIIGELFVGDDKARMCWTLELPWRDNKRMVSCIPEGKYKWRLRDPSPKFDYVHIAIDGVAGRDNILIHAGNHPDDITGCILAGADRGVDFVFESRRALGKLVKYLEGSGSQSGWLVVESAP